MKKIKAKPPTSAFNYQAALGVLWKNRSKVKAAWKSSKSRRRSDLATKRASLYQLPWYLVAVPVLVALTLVAIPLGWFIHQSGQLGSRMMNERRGSLIFLILLLLLLVILFGRANLK